MLELLPIGIVLITVLVVLFLLFRTLASNPAGKRKKQKDRNSIIREANKRLSQNPKDPEALSDLADLHYREGDMEKAMKIYKILLEMCATNPDLDEFEISLRYGLTSLNMKVFDEAYKSLIVAKSIRPDIFEINYNLGYLEYTRKNYEKAAALLAQARTQEPEHALSLRYLGHSLFKLKKLKEARNYLSKAIDLEPNDKESIFVMGQCYHELGQLDQATNIFSHLRADPELGPNAALYAGTINLNTHNYPKAITDFELGLRHKVIKPEILVELKYRLASAYVKQQEIGNAVKYLKDIQLEYPNYKDVAMQIKKFSELSQNKNLKTYLMAPTSEFITLCRKLTSVIFPKAKVKIIDITVHKSEYVDILAEVYTRRWEDIVLFRFVRTNRVVGELLLRDFHARIKDLKAGRGFIASAGTYSEGAERFVEGRLIDLIEKDSLMKHLRKIEANVLR